MQTSVAIAGGGPVGLMLALFLDHYGVKSVLFNTEETTRWHPKGGTEGARAMEHFRRLGFAHKIRELGLPDDHPTDVAYFTRFTGHELARLPMPSRNQVLQRVAVSPKIDQVPEPVHRANQMQVDRFLFDHARTRPNIELRFGWHVKEFDQSKDSVSLVAERTADGRSEAWNAAYLVGCDGGRSTVREGLGIKYGGEAGIEQNYLGGRMFSTYVRSPTLFRDFLSKRAAWQYWAVNPEIRSTIFSLNGRDEFLLRTRATSADQPPEDETVAGILRRCTGADVEMEIIAHSPWTAGMALVAERMSEGRVFLAGDAAHLFTPTGGFGMNTGIDGVSNLSWKLAAAVQGWGGPGLLESYEAERLPIGHRNTKAARKLTRNIGETDVDPCIEDDSAEGSEARRKASEMLSGFGEQFASIGVQLGARYDGSALIVENGDPPPDQAESYTPTSVPGGRTPHYWLDDERTYGSSLYDRLGSGFSLLRFGARAPDVGDFVAASARRKIPLKVLDIADPEARDLYQCDLALVRPDQYVAWRSDRAPADADDLLSRVVGGTP